MTRSHKTLGFLLVTLVGLWGCSRAPSGNAGAAKNSALEAKAQRLEEDFRAAAAARDQFRQKLIAAEERLAAAESRAGQLQTQAEEARTSLAAANTELRTRTAERDNLSAQYDVFRKGLKNLLGQAEIALANPGGSLSPVEPTLPAAPPPTALRN